MVGVRDKYPVYTTQRWGRLAFGFTLLALPGCAVRRTTRISPPEIIPAARVASTAALITQINAQSESIRTLTATVDLAPTAGSIYSGVIKEYHDVKSFILIEKPALIRMIGQAPVIRTNIFDMASDGEEFRVYIPSKQKFIMGKLGVRRPVKNPLENLRPQHILDALLIPSIDLSREKYSHEVPAEGGGRYFILSILEPNGEKELDLERKVWFDRSNLEIVRLQLYDPEGIETEDVQYSAYQDFGGIHYPTRIQVTRPVEDYRLSITVLKATFNQPIDPEKFKLTKPENAQLVELSARASPGRSAWSIR